VPVLFLEGFELLEHLLPWRSPLFSRQSHNLALIADGLSVVTVPSLKPSEAVDCWPPTNPLQKIQMHLLQKWIWYLEAHCCSSPSH
jgi:hypothetical protein